MITIGQDNTAIAAKGSDTVISFGTPTTTATTAAALRAAAAGDPVALAEQPRSDISVEDQGNTLTGGGTGITADVTGDANTATLGGGEQHRHRRR